MKATILLATVAASLVLLSACASQPPVPMGLTDAQLEVLAQPALDSQWLQIEPYVGATERPAVDRKHFIKPDDWQQSIADCLDDKGFFGGSAMSFTADGSILQTGPILDETAYHLAQYTCEAEFPIDPRYFGALSAAQLNYLYDYYRRWTIPCLNANDYPVPVLPTRQEFLRTGNPDWTPYFNPQAAGGVVPPTVLRGRCGVVPKGLFPAEYVEAVSDGQDRVNGWGRWSEN